MGFAGAEEEIGWAEAARRARVRRTVDGMLDAFWLGFAEAERGAIVDGEVVLADVVWVAGDAGSERTSGCCAC